MKDIMFNSECSAGRASDLTDHHLGIDGVVQNDVKEYIIRQLNHGAPDSLILLMKDLYDPVYSLQCLVYISAACD